MTERLNFGSAEADTRDHELFRLAIHLRLAASNAVEENYYIGYASGISRRIAGEVGPDEPEAVAFELLQDAPGGLVQALGRGYRDGLKGKSIAMRSTT